jgi:hypothetical protein
MAWPKMPDVMYVYQYDLVDDERVYAAIEDPMNIELLEPGKMQIGIYKLESVQFLQVKKELVGTP